MSKVATIGDPVLPEAKLNLVSPNHPVIGRVVAAERCTKGKSHSFVRHVSIDVSGTPLAGNFLVGQSFGVIPPGVDMHGKPHKVRLFSIATPSYGDDGDGNVLATTAKRVIDEFRPREPDDDPQDHSLFLGVCSNYLCDLRDRAEVNVSGPNGKRFLLPVNPDDHDFLFVATGTGIAPYRGMALELLTGPNGPCHSQIHLVMGSPYSTDLLYDDLFRRLEAKYENFHYYPAISREPRHNSHRGVYVHELIDERIETFGPLLQSSRTLIYICGVLGMQVGMYQAIARHGLGDGYLIIKDELAGVPPSEWRDEQLKRYVRPTRRCMVEVYE